MVSKTITQFLSCLNNEDEDGGFWLPNIQREFVWSEKQIERLFDSILRNYPIGNFLVWRTKADSPRRRFIDNYRPKDNVNHYLEPGNSRTKNFVLDGQQRLQSLYIGLKGSYDGRELYFDVSSGEEKPPEDIKFVFKFMDPHSPKAGFPYIKMKEIVYPADRKWSEVDIRKSIFSQASRELTDREKEKIERNISLIHSYFLKENRAYNDIDSVTYYDLYTENDIVEIFIRANSGGTKLSKSDLLFSLLTASWIDAVNNVNELLSDLNNAGYNFSRDFIMKTCLTLLDMGSEYDVEKFRTPDIEKKFNDNWEEMAKTIKDVVDYIKGTLYIRSAKALPSHTPLIPLFYYRSHSGKKLDSIDGVKDYLIKTLLTGAFSGHTDTTINRCIDNIKRADGSFEFNTTEILEVIKEDKNITLSKETLFKWSYNLESDKPYIYLLFNLWYMNFDVHPIYSGNSPQIDHIFPRSVLKDVKKINPDTGRKVSKYLPYDINQLANLMLLSADENGPRNKSDKLPEEWFKDQDDKYFMTHLIPRDPELWKLENYEEFIEARKHLLVEKFKSLNLLA